MTPSKQPSGNLKCGAGLAALSAQICGVARLGLELNGTVFWPAEKERGPHYAALAFSCANITSRSCLNT